MRFLGRMLGAIGVIAIASMILVVALEGRPSSPALLSTVEYAIDPATARLDRADARAHEEALASIEAARAAEASQWLTLQIFGAGALLLVGLCVTLAIRGATEVKVARLLQGPARRGLEADEYRIVEGRAYPAAPPYEQRKEIAQK